MFETSSSQILKVGFRKKKLIVATQIPTKKPLKISGFLFCGGEAMYARTGWHGAIMPENEMAQMANQGFPHYL
jgi:hypothetical protein